MSLAAHTHPQLYEWDLYWTECYLCQSACVIVTAVASANRGHVHRNCKQFICFWRSPMCYLPFLKCFIFSARFFFNFVSVGDFKTFSFGILIWSVGPFFFFNYGHFPQNGNFGLQPVLARSHTFKMKDEILSISICGSPLTLVWLLIYFLHCSHACRTGLHWYSSMGTFQIKHLCLVACCGPVLL